MKRLYVKLFRASIALAAFSFISNARAQTCITPPTCESLGYTKSAIECEGHDFLKCPFNTQVGYCDAGSGNSGTCKTPLVGSFLYSDMSCSTIIEDGKTIIGIIFDSERRLAIALEDSNTFWANFTLTSRIPGITYYPYYLPTSDFKGKNNTKIIAEYCKSIGKNCAAIEYVNSYKTEGTNAGDWYLPAGGELELIINKRDKIENAVNYLNNYSINADSLIGYYWTSSMNENELSWIYNFNDNKWGTLNDWENGNRNEARPIIAF